jgi:hypothetical protein
MQVTSLLQTIRGWAPIIGGKWDRLLAALHLRKPKAPAIPLPPAIVDQHPARPPATRKVKAKRDEIGPDGNRWRFRREDVEQAGTFYFRGGLLDDLGGYFRVIARLKKAHTDAFDLYSKVGATLVPPKGLFGIKTLPSIWHDSEQRPTFGAISLVSKDLKDSDEHIYAHLMYFMKLDVPPADVAPTSGDVYEVTLYYDHIRAKYDKKCPKWMRKAGFCLQFHVAVEGRDRVRVLKRLQTSYQQPNYRAGGKWRRLQRQRRSGNKGSCTDGQGGATHIPTKVWDYPRLLIDHYKDQRWADVPNKPSIDEYGTWLLCFIANSAIAQELGVRIAVTDAQGLTASFSVDTKRMAYFFKDRDVVLTERGKTARIFHVVRPHERTLKSGKVTYLKMGFRGLRRFTWAGYQVHVTVPGLHHTPLFEFDGGMFDNQTAQALGLDMGASLDLEQLGDSLHRVTHDEQAIVNEELKRMQHEPRGTAAAE